MRKMLAVVCLLACAPVWAADVQGTVRGIYFEAARGVLVEARMHRDSAATRWADVEVDGIRRKERVDALVELHGAVDA